MESYKKIISRCTSCNDAGCLSLCRNEYFCKQCDSWFTLWAFNLQEVICEECEAINKKSKGKKSEKFNLKKLL